MRAHLAHCCSINSDIKLFILSVFTPEGDRVGNGSTFYIPIPLLPDTASRLSGPCPRSRDQTNALKCRRKKKTTKL